jgi:hypothetical protein
VRRDGSVVFFAVEHWSDWRGGWVGSDLTELLFGGLTHEQRRSPLADHYRELLSKQGAGTPLWQEFGIHGFVDAADARRMLREVTLARPDHQFRLVCRAITQTTRVVAT